MNDNYISKMDELSRKEKVKSDAEKIRRPSLLMRIASGALDLLFIFILLALLELLTVLTLFEPLGYFEAESNINQIFSQSKLYVQKDGLNVLIYNAIDESKSIDENYDVPITYYYTNDSRCQESNKLDEYNNSKIQSGLFFFDDNDVIVKKDDVSDVYLENFYKDEYSKALNFLTQDANYIESVNKTFNLTVYSLLTAFLISAFVFYFLIPLLRKDGETVGQILCRICLIDSRDNTSAKRLQIALRSLVVVALNFLIPFYIFVFFNYFTLLTVLVSFTAMCLMKYNKGLQDLASQTHVVVKRKFYSSNVM